MKKELVSIITPLYNCEKYIIDTIKSVESQTYQDWEMIIVDDKSTDSSLKSVKTYCNGKKRFKIIELDKNSGGAFSRNTAIKAAQGRYIAFLDSDDLWHPEKLEKQIKFMNDFSYDFTFTAYRHITEDGELTDKCVNVREAVEYKTALYHNPIGCLTAVYDAKNLGKFYMPAIRKRQDYALWLKILKSGINAYGLNETLSFYRLRKNSVSSNKFDLIKYHWILYFNIEKLGLFKSLYYLSSVIFYKLFGKL